MPRMTAPTEALNHYIARQLKAAREAQGWGTREASRRIGIAHGTLTNYELGDRAIPLAIIERAARAYGQSICWFVDPAALGPAGPGVVPELRSLLSTVAPERQAALVPLVREMVRLGREVPDGDAE